MSRRIVLAGLVVGLLVPALPAAAAPPPEWIAFYDGPGGDVDRASDVAVDPVTGTVVVTGSSYNLQLDDDITTVAYTADGSLLWSARAAGVAGGFDGAAAIAVDSARGTVYVVGGLSTDSSVDAVVVAYDLAGNEIWRTVSGTPARGESWREVTVDPGSGAVLVTGTTIGGGFVDLDVITQAVEPDGQVRWTRAYRGPGDEEDRPADLALAPDGSAVFVVGNSFDEGGELDGLTLAYDVATGALRWVARVEAPSLMASADLSAVDVAPDGSAIYAAGSVGGSGLTVAYDLSGARLWSRGLDEPMGRASLSEVDVGADGTVFVAGGRTLAAERRQVLTAAAYTPSGRRLWTTTVDNPEFGREGTQDLVVDPTDDTLYLAADRLVNDDRAYNDVLVVSLAGADGALGPVARYAGPDQRDDSVRALALDPQRRLLVATGVTQRGPALIQDYLTLAFALP